MPRTKKQNSLALRQDSLSSIEGREAQFNALKVKYLDIMDPLSFGKVSPEDILPTPSTSINLLCGEDRGIRKGSIVHCYGPMSSLKTWIALEMCREAQHKWPDKVVAYIDTEYRVDLYQASKLINVDISHFDTGVPKFIYNRPYTGESTWELIAALAATGYVSLIVLDSATAMRSRNTVEESEFSLGQIGNASRINSAALNKYSPLFPLTGTILWVTNQERIVSMKPVVSKGPTGGSAWGFFSTHMFKLEKVTKEREKEEQSIQVFSQKMKWARGFKSVEVPIILGKGIDSNGDLINCAIHSQLIEQAGSWITIGNQKVQGLSQASKFLEENPDIRDELISAINELGE